MISFVFSDYDYYYLDYLQKLHYVYLVVNPNTLGEKPRAYCETRAGYGGEREKKKLNKKQDGLIFYCVKFIQKMNSSSLGQENTKSTFGTL